MFVTTLNRLMDFFVLAETLKTEERHCWYQNGRRESVAEHVWRMALMAMSVAPHLQRSVNMERLLKIIIVHDIVEAVVGDTPFFESQTKDAKTAKQARESMAIGRIRDMLGSPTGEEICALWNEYEAAETFEARVAKALDKLEANSQHNSSPIDTWTDKDQERVYGIDRFCTCDPFLQALNEQIKTEGACKMVQAGIDLNAVKQRIGVC